VTKRYGEATRFFCGLFGLFATTLCPLVYLYGWDKLIAGTFSKTYLALLIIGTPIVGVVFIFVAIKGHAPTWWTKWIDSSELGKK